MLGTPGKKFCFDVSALIKKNTFHSDLTLYYKLTVSLSWNQTETAYRKSHLISTLLQSRHIYFRLSSLTISVIHGQLQHKIIKCKVPEINNSQVLNYRSLWVRWRNWHHLASSCSGHESSLCPAYPRYICCMLPMQ